MVKKCLSIAMTTDQNYILQTRVAIWSMLNAAKKDIFFNIHILCSPKLGKEHRKKIEDLQSEWKNMDIRFDEIDEKIFQDAKTTAYIPVASFYRLLISHIIKDDKCLFLDGDMIINTDLSEIYDTDLTGLYLAGVKDCCIQYNMEEQASYKDILEIPTMENYINAGVLLMNLKMIRDNDMEKVFLSYIDKHYKMMDQDILNKCCYGKIEQLDLRFNFFADYYERVDILKSTSFNQKEIDEVKRYGGIIHFPGRYKPWQFVRMRGSSVWWENAKKALHSVDYDEIYGYAMKNMRNNDWKYIIERCQKADSIIVVGFSDIGKDMADSLKRCGINNIECFCDNSKEKQGTYYQDIQVLSIEKAYERYPEALWINTSQNSAKVISGQLMSMGVKEEHILIYVYKSEQYYDNLDEQYQEYESKLLAYKQSGVEC
ncbi:MAG: glycosyltransferase family 8 protein [Bacillus sp. (in: Bacteria)]|nr:glycosyltransferase family 8 protein [Bacillus sp. (in: firmicutes)]MCM1425835.1 glycosyltransferase family 8 protein [Eubacterium sp.]